MSNRAETKFHGLELAVEAGRVFSPRPATERLVDKALEFIAADEVVRVADVGTGSGAIAVALAVARPHAQLWATDTNAAAVELARSNAERHGVADRVRVLHGDLLDAVPLPVDLVVANLPYLSDSLHDPRYADEPPDAIYAPGDGLDPYRRLLNACREGRLVTPGGHVIVQFHREALAADCWQLEELRDRLEQHQAAAA